MAYGIYICSNRKCAQSSQEFKAMLPSEAKAATGQHVHCSLCGEVACLWEVKE